MGSKYPSANVASAPALIQKKRGSIGTSRSSQKCSRILCNHQNSTQHPVKAAKKGHTKGFFADLAEKEDILIVCLYRFGHRGARSEETAVDVEIGRCHGSGTIRLNSHRGGLNFKRTPQNCEYPWPVE